MNPLTDKCPVNLVFSFFDNYKSGTGVSNTEGGWWVGGVLKQLYSASSACTCKACSCFTCQIQTLIQVSKKKKRKEGRRTEERKGGTEGGMKEGRKRKTG